MDEEASKEIAELRASHTALNFLVYKIVHIGLGITIGWVASKLGVSKVLGLLL